MPSARLQQQFIRLWQCCEGKSQDTTLNELAALLSCSRRHMRTLLNTMQDRGWLTWEAEVGRGKRSRLTFLYTGLALQQQRAEDLLEAGSYRPTSAVGWRQSDCAANAGFSSGPQLPPGAAHPARALLSSVA
ncbi:putative substrate-binding protein [Escherichia coli]|uniref:Putative substrate-binding protein n=1 Tax=Escherichia coli TaxID=562 RepID=A0A2X3KJ70_ECOLX|nr:putative substrate-binding protein [Escherichia coli]